MFQKFANIDIFNNSKVIYMRKSSNKIISWINILIIGSILLGLIIFFYEFDDYNIYYAKIINNDDDNYLTMNVDEEFIELQNRNYLHINDEDRKCHLRFISDNYYIFNDSKYWTVMFDCNIPSSLNIDQNLVKVKIEKEKTTLFKKLKKKIREGIDYERTNK